MYPHRLEYFDVNNSDRQKHVLGSICMELKVYIFFYLIVYTFFVLLVYTLVFLKHKR